MAYADKPLRDGNVHISAPHIYGSVLEALELPKNSSLCFLNAGSGTGYLTCIAATILGHRSNHYCAYPQMFFDQISGRFHFLTLCLL